MTSPAAFASLRTQIRAGLNVAISGIPWWTTDIGGFHGGDPDDPRAWQADDAYMFGPDLLVAPVASYGSRQRPVYLPEGSRWASARTAETIPGGTDLTTDAPLSRIPLFLRDGATLPIAPVDV